MKQRLSVVIPTFNAGETLKDCLKSVKWANEIICVDMGSLDDTLKICKLYNVKVVKNIPQEGNFDLNRKLGMELAIGDWILKIDSDDRLSKALQQSIRKVMKGNKKIDGYKFYNRVYFFNKEIKYGHKSFNSHELRLFRKKRWIYEPYKFHQMIQVKGVTAFLNGRYFHFNSQSVAEFIEKTNFYTNLDAKKDFSVRKDVSFLHAIISPIYTFIKLFFLRLGFLDFTYGLIVSILYSIYNFIYKIKIWEKRK